MYKCCFLVCCQRVQRRKAELTLAQIREKLPNGWADWHQIWLHMQIHMGMDIRQTNCPSRHKGHLGGFRGSTIQKSGNLSDWHQLWFMSADSFGNGHKYKSPLNTPGGISGGGLGCHKFKSLGSCQTAGLIGTKFSTHLQIHLGMDVRQTSCPSRHTWRGLGVKHSKVLGSCQMSGPIGTKFGTRRLIRLGMDIG